MHKEYTNYFSTYELECSKYTFVKGSQLENAKKTKVFLKILEKSPEETKYYEKINQKLTTSISVRVLKNCIEYEMNTLISLFGLSEIIKEAA